MPARIAGMVLASPEAGGGKRYLDALDDRLFAPSVKPILPRRQDLNVITEAGLDQTLPDLKAQSRGP